MNNRKASYSGIFAMFLIGGLIGTALVLLFSPHSGKRIRKRLQRASTQLRREAGVNVYLSTKRVNNFIHTCFKKINHNLIERIKK